MKRTLGTLLLTALLVAGCGSGQDQAVDDPSSSSDVPSTSASSEPSAPAAEPTTVAILPQTGAGGMTRRNASRLTDVASVGRFATQLGVTELSDGLVEQLRDTVRQTDVPPGQEMYAAVVAVGCDVPAEVSVERNGDGVTIIADRTADSVPECFAPVTSVAVVLVSG